MALYLTGNALKKSWKSPRSYVPLDVDSFPLGTTRPLGKYREKSM
jgi:hypothetical protein